MSSASVIVCWFLLHFALVTHGLFNASHPMHRKPVSLTNKTKNTNLQICNGEAANFDQYPYMVPLYDNHGSCFCSGSILYKSGSLGTGVILTAAHCLFSSMRRGQVCVGCTRWTSPHNDPGARMYDIDFYAIHPQYDSYEIEYDVGLIYLKQPIIDPIGVDSVQIDVCSQPVSTGNSLRIQGYGTTEQPQSPQLMAGQTSFIDAASCNSMYESGGYYGWILPSMQCMTNVGCCNAQSTDCYGDSGSPIMQMGTLNAIGVVSWGVDTGGSGCCPTDMPSVIADLCDPDIKGWISQA